MRTDGAEGGRRTPRAQGDVLTNQRTNSSGPPKRAGPKPNKGLSKYKCAPRHTVCIHTVHVHKKANGPDTSLPAFPRLFASPEGSASARAGEPGEPLIGSHRGRQDWMRGTRCRGQIAWSCTCLCVCRRGGSGCWHSSQQDQSLSWSCVMSFPSLPTHKQKPST